MEIRDKIETHFSVKAEYLWAKYPDCAVFRHTHHRKWFCILMKLEANKIGLLSLNEKVWVINVKAKSEEIGSLRMIKWIYPAYHMNKEHWLSLNVSEIDEILLWELLDESFHLTFKK